MYREMQTAEKLNNIEEELQKRNKLLEQQNKLINTQNNLMLQIVLKNDKRGTTAYLNQKNNYYWLD